MGRIRFRPLALNGLSALSIAAFEAESDPINLEREMAIQLERLSYAICRADQHAHAPVASSSSLVSMLQDEPKQKRGAERS
jgi:hypothetical protein